MSCTTGAAIEDILYGWEWISDNTDNFSIAPYPPNTIDVTIGSKKNWVHSETALASQNKAYITTTGLGYSGVPGDTSTYRRGWGPQYYAFKPKFSIAPSTDISTYKDWFLTYTLESTTELFPYLPDYNPTYPRRWKAITQPSIAVEGIQNRGRWATVSISTYYGEIDAAEYGTKTTINFNIGQYRKSDDSLVSSAIVGFPAIVTTTLQSNIG